MIEYLRGGGVVVAANARAARALERDFALAQQEAGHQAWSAPAITTWQLWLEQLWQQHIFNSTESRLLLSSLQERTVWTRIVERDAAAEQVLSPDSLASLAQQAFALLNEYRAHPYRRSSWGSGNSQDSGRDAEAFRSWAAAFDRECLENNWISQSNLAAELSKHIQNGTVTVAKEIQTLAFDRFTPAQHAFLDLAKESGSLVRAYRQPQTETEVKVYAAQDRSSEIDQCAHWLRSRLLKHPGERLAIVVTEAREIRGELERALRRVLMPASMYLIGGTESHNGGAADRSLPNSKQATATVTEGEHNPVFEFSLGVPLASLPVIRAALLLLRWLLEPLRQEEITWLLLSGFLAGKEADATQLAGLDAHIRDKALLPPEIELAVFLKQKQFARTEAAAHIFEQLSKYANAASKSGIPGRKRLAMEWAEEAQLLLSAAGWPGPQLQSSLRFQALEKWEQLLTEMATLNFDGIPMNYRGFVKVLEGHAAETLFAPESREAPVQIIGAFESSGQQFDALWFMGAEEEAWPGKGKANPLIPIAIQRAVAMPHASVEVDWELASVATERIASSAAEGVFSYAIQNGDGALRISPLVSRFLKSADSNFIPGSSPAPPVNGTATVAIEEVEESSPIPWPSDRIAGGAEVLTSQSACAFQAFARKRLRTADLQCAEWGLTALIRGELLHEVLSKVWRGEQGLSSLDGLQTAVAERELEPLLEREIAGVFQNHKATRGADGWILAYLETEKLRIKKLLLLWLDYEARRQPFEVEECEKKIDNFQAGDLKLRVRLDRVDRLPDGRKLLIDYKTGAVSAKEWESPRPDQPQLPLYATFGELGAISGLLFAQIRAGSLEFKGQVDAPREQLMATLNGRKGSSVVPLTAEARQAWRDELLRLANDFLDGDAAVAPKNYPKTCTHCGLQGLCRVAATDVPLEASDVDALDENGQAEPSE